MPPTRGAVRPIVPHPASGPGLSQERKYRTAGLPIGHRKCRELLSDSRKGATRSANGDRYLAPQDECEGLPAPRKLALARPRSSVDRKSTRLNSSHSQISYAVFCLKKK